MSRSVLVSALSVLSLLFAGCGGSGGGQDNPAATVNGHTIPMTDYDTQVNVLRHQAASQSQTGIDPCSGGSFYAVFCQKLHQQALDTLVAAELVHEYAQQHHISVSNADFNRQWTVIVATQFKGDPAVAADYARSLDVTVEDLKNFERLDMLRNQVMYRVTIHMSPFADEVRISRIFVRNKKELHSVQLLLRTNHPFNQVAATLSHNLTSLCAKTQCGELGWIPDAFVPSAERSIVTSRDGSVVGPFASQGGFSLFQVEAHRKHAVMTSKQQLSRRQQLFAQWLTQQRRKATIHRYVKY